MLEYQNIKTIFAKGYTPLSYFYEKKLQKKTKEFTIKQVIKRKGHKLYLK